MPAGLTSGPRLCARSHPRSLAPGSLESAEGLWVHFLTSKAREARAGSVCSAQHVAAAHGGRTRRLIKTQATAIWRGFWRPRSQGSADIGGNSARTLRGEERQESRAAGPRRSQVRPGSRVGACRRQPIHVSLSKNQLKKHI